MNVQNESMYLNEIHFVLLGNVPLLIFIIIIGLISTNLQNLARRPCTSDENTY